MVLHWELQDGYQVLLKVMLLSSEHCLIRKKKFTELYSIKGQQP